MTDANWLTFGGVILVLVVTAVVIYKKGQQPFGLAPKGYSTHTNLTDGFWMAHRQHLVRKAVSNVGVSQSLLSVTP